MPTHYGDYQIMSVFYLYKFIKEKFGGLKKFKYILRAHSEYYNQFKEYMLEGSFAPPKDIHNIVSFYPVKGLPIFQDIVKGTQIKNYIKQQKLPMEWIMGFDSFESTQWIIFFPKKNIMTKAGDNELGYKDLTPLQIKMVGVEQQHQFR